MENLSVRPPTLLAFTPYLAASVAHLGRRLAEGVLAEHELRLPHFAVLAALADFGSLAQHELADRLGGNRSHLVGYVDHLQSRGLVSRERDERDRRRQHVALTAEGEAQLRLVGDALRHADETFLAALDECDRRTLTGLLRRVLAANDQARQPLCPDGEAAGPRTVQPSG